MMLKKSRRDNRWEPWLIFTACAATLSACAPITESTSKNETAAAPAFRQKTIDRRSEHNAPATSAAGTRITIAVPQTTAGAPPLRKAVDGFVDGWVRSRLDGLQPDRPSPGATWEDLADGCIASWADFHREHPAASHGWYIDLDGRIAWRNNRLVTLRLRWESYTGGAHPNRGETWVSFDSATGARLGPGDLAGDTETLKNIAEKHFRQEKNIAPDTDLNAAGWWFEDGVFSLPPDVAAVEEGLMIYWPPYAIGPYTAGETYLAVPREDIEHNPAPRIPPAPE